MNPEINHRGLGVYFLGETLESDAGLIQRGGLKGWSEGYSADILGRSAEFNSPREFRGGITASERSSGIAEVKNRHVFSNPPSDLYLSDADDGFEPIEIKGGEVAPRNGARELLVMW
jgi:hypothetical protein